MNSNINENKKKPFEPLRRDLQLFKDKKGNDRVKGWVLFDPVADKYFHIGGKEHLILSLLNRSYTAEDLFEKAGSLDNTIKETDIKSTIIFLQNNNLLQASHLMTEGKLMQDKSLKQAGYFNRILHSYLFFRIPIWKPDKFLSNTLSIVKMLCSKWMMIIFTSIALCGYISLIVHWNKFEITIVESLNYSGMIRYGVTIIFLKIIHEFAHAYAAKSCGVRVRRFGIGFIVFFPRFFTNLTDSWRLGDKKSKLMIDAAGILVELMLGGIAILFWAYSGPGIIKIIAYYIFAVSIINTVLVNGNPFIRYDGYYLLMDSLGIDNLQQKSRVLISKIFRELFFGIKTNIQFKIHGPQKYLLILYGVSAFIYKIFLYTGIILIVYYKFTKVIGVFLVALEVYLLILGPLYKEIKIILKLKKKTERKNIIITFVIFVICMSIFFIPLPWTVSLPCVIASKNDKMIYAKEAGFIQNINTEGVMNVKKGEQLFKLDNPFLKYENRLLNVKLNVLMTELDWLRALFNSNRKESIKSKIQQIMHIKNRIYENVRKQNLLTVKSPIDGTFILFDWYLKAGKWLNKGVSIGQVYSNKSKVVYAYTEEHYLDSFKEGGKVKIYLKDNMQVFYGTILSINPVPVKEWHLSPLLDIAGGDLHVLKKSGFNSYILKKYFYQITIKPSMEYKALRFSRTGVAHIREFSSVGLNFIRTVISTIQREFSF